MTQKDDGKRLVELKNLFLRLEDTSQNSALLILRSLEFAQSIFSGANLETKSREPPVNCSA